MRHRIADDVELVQKERERGSGQRRYKSPRGDVDGDRLDETFERSESQYECHKRRTGDHQEQNGIRTKQHRQDGPKCLDTTDLQPKASELIDFCPVLDLRDALPSERTKRPNVERDGVVRVCGSHDPV